MAAARFAPQEHSQGAAVGALVAHVMKAGASFMERYSRALAAADGPGARASSRIEELARG